jgi:hypothetical protein
MPAKKYVTERGRGLMKPKPKHKKRFKIKPHVQHKPNIVRNMMFVKCLTF